MEFVPKAMRGPAAHTVKCCSDKLDFVHPFLLPSDCEGIFLFFYFLWKPSSYVFISEEKNDEPSVGVVMLILPGQSPRVYFECPVTLCVLTPFFPVT